MTTTPKVQAATILSSLRNELIQGVSLTLDMTGDGTRVSGTVDVKFKEALTAAQLFPATEQEATTMPAPEPEALALDLRFEPTGGGGAGGEGATGFSGTVRAAFGGETDWMYARASALPGAVTQDLGVLSGFVSNALRQGVIVDLGANGLQGLAGELDMDDTKVLGEAGNVDAGGSGVQVRVGTQVQEGPAGVELPEGASISVSPSVNVTVGAPAGGDGAQHDQFMGLVRPLLTGQASGAQLQQLAELAQGHGQSSVEDLGSGRYLLRTTMAPDVGDAGASPTTMSISYEQGAGVRWVELAFDDAGARGTVRITPLSGGIDPTRLEKARAVPAGAPTPLDFNGPAIMQLFGGGGGENALPQGGE